MVRSLKVHAAGSTPPIAAVQPGTTTNSVGGQFAPGLDGLPNPAVAIGAVDLAPPPCGPCCTAVSLCTRHRPRPSRPLGMRVSAALGEQLERARVEPSVALVVDPVGPGLPRGDLIGRVSESGVGSGLGRCPDRASKRSPSRYCSTSAASSRCSARSCSWLAMVLNFQSLCGGRAKGRERVRPNERWL